MAEIKVIGESTVEDTKHFYFLQYHPNRALIGYSAAELSQ